MNEMAAPPENGQRIDPHEALVIFDGPVCLPQAGPAIPSAED